MTCDMLFQTHTKNKLRSDVDYTFVTYDKCSAVLVLHKYIRLRAWPYKIEIYFIKQSMLLFHEQAHNTKIDKET